MYTYRVQCENIKYFPPPSNDVSGRAAALKHLKDGATGHTASYTYWFVFLPSIQSAETLNTFASSEMGAVDFYLLRQHQSSKSLL